MLFRCMAPSALSLSHFAFSYRVTLHASILPTGAKRNAITVIESALAPFSNVLRHTLLG
jgi:hypothetical protein